MFRAKKIFLTIAACSAIFFAPAPAIADSTTFNSIFFEPAYGRNTYFMLRDSATLHGLQFDFGVVSSYAYRPLEMRDYTGSIRSVIDRMVVIDLMPAFGITEWLMLGADLPIVPVNMFRDPVAVPVPAMQNYFNIGDLTIEAKARMLDSCADCVGLAIAPFMTIPTGNDTHYAGDPGVGGGVRLALEGKLGRRFGLALNAGYRAGRKVHLNNIEYQQRLLLGGGFEVNLNRGVDITGEVNADSALNKLFTDRDLNPTEAMAGVKWDIEKTGVTLRAGGGTCLVCGVKGSKIRAALGIDYRVNTKKMKRLDEEAQNICAAKFAKPAEEIIVVPPAAEADIQIRPIYFAYGGFGLGPKMHAALDEAIAAMNAIPWARIVVVGGHTDDVGLPRANEKLSMRRANAVIKYMKANGLRPDIELVPLAYGSMRPVSGVITPKTRAQNRRVTFFVVDLRRYGIVSQK